MSHRRKNAHPLCKQKRLGSVVDRVLAAKAKQQNNEDESEISAIQSSVTVKELFSQSDNSNVTQSANDDSEKESVASSTCQSSVSLLDDSNQNLAIPDDLFKDFQALKNATNLDTADLMRRLISDYARIKNSEEKSVQEDEKKDLLVAEETQDVSRLSEYYKNDVQSEKINNSYEGSDNSSEPLDLSTIKMEASSRGGPQEIANVIGQILPSKSPVSVVAEPRQGSHLFPTNIETNRSIGAPGMYFYTMGPDGYVVPALESSMKVPTVVHNMAPQCLETQGEAAENAFRELANKSLELQQQSAMLIANGKGGEVTALQPMGNPNVSPGLGQRSPVVSQTENCREVQFQNCSVKIKGTKLHPEIQVGDLMPKIPNSPSTSTLSEIVQGSTAFQTIATVENTVGSVSSGRSADSKLSESMPVLSRNLSSGVSMGTVQTTSQEIINNLSPGQQQQPVSIQNIVTPTELQNVDLAQNVTATQFHNQMQELQKIAARTSEVSNTTKPAKNSKKSGQMKLIAENTSHHGVYTSVLKLPWSRRTRTPKSDHGSQSKAAQQQQLQQQQQQQQQQQPMVLLPVTAGLSTTNGGVFIPASSLTMTSSPITTDTVTTSMVSSANSMMMVYPNASFANVGRQIRKRGRPPKVPVLARMLAEANKQAMDMQMQNYIPNFTACQQPAAIVLNVNNMVNTAGAMNSVNSMNTSATANANATTVVSANPNSDGVAMETIPTQVTDINGSIPSISSAVTVQPLLTKDSTTPTNVAMDTEQQIFASGNTHQLQGTASVPGNILNTLVPQQTSDSPSLKSSPSEMKTITTTSVTNTESGAMYQEMILSSKSLVNVQPRRRQTTTELLKSKSGTDNFICTSFRLRSLSGKNKEKKASAVPGMKRRGRPPKRRLLPVFEPPPIEKKDSGVGKIPSAMQITEPHIIAQLYGQNQSVLLPDNIHGETRYSLPRELTPDQIEGMNSDASQQEPRLFDSAVDGNYDNPLLSNQFNVEHSQSDENLSHEESNERFVFSSDEEEIGGQRSLMDVSSDESTGSPEDEGTNSSEMFQKLFHCKVCDEIIPVEKKNEHRDKHAVIKIKCKECGNICCKFLMKDQVESDISNVCDSCDKKGQKVLNTVNCDHCQEQFPDPKGLKYHIKSKHPDIYLQQRTKLLLSRKHGANKDLTQTKSNELKVYECPIDDCGKKFYSKFRIKIHLKKRHETQQSLPCIYDGCKKKFQSNVQLQEHIKFKHYSIKGYKCSWPGCDEEFPTERNLKVHLLIHKDEKPLKCEFCDYRCRQKNALNWHVRKHHPEASNALKSFGTSGSSASSAHDEMDDE